MRHPGLVRKLALASGGYHKSGYVPDLARFMLSLDAICGDGSDRSAHPLGPDRMSALREELLRVAPLPRRWSCL